MSISTINEDFVGLSVMEDELHAAKGRPRPTEPAITNTAVVSPTSIEDTKTFCLDANGEKLRLQPEGGFSHSIHGRLGLQSWAGPVMTKYCKSEARPGYATTLAHEYCDDDDVLDKKVELLARLMTASHSCLLYTGAGLSTAAGIGDYATRDSSGNRVPTLAMQSPIMALPTIAHYVLGDLCGRGIIKQWIQQNHDGLPQKAGVSQSILNEIHGAWYDPSNPVVKMDGNLRDDLYNRLLSWEQRADLTISLGTSMSGMNADRVFTTVSKKAIKLFKKKRSFSLEPKNGKVFGGVIIGIQCTQYDDMSSLRIFAKIDTVMELLMHKLGLCMPACQPAVLAVPPLLRTAEHQFLVPYNPLTGMLDPDGLKNKSSLTVLDLTPGRIVRLTSGPYEGDTGEVMYITGQGMYQIQFNHEINKTTKVRKLFMRALGWWWIQDATAGLVDSIPVVNI